GIGVTNISGTLTNTTNTAQTATYTVTPTAGSCTGTTFTVTVSLNPTAVITAMTTISCSGVTFTLTPINGTNGIVPAGTTYSWAAPTVTGGLLGGLSGTAAVSIIGTLNNPTSIVQTATYIVTPSTVNCGVGTTFTITVTINPTAAITAMTKTSCSGVAFSLTPIDGTNGIVPAGSTYTWTAPTGAGFTGGAAQGVGVNTITGNLSNTTNTAQTATYIVTPTSGSCTGNTFTVTISLNPAATITAMTSVNCSGVTFTLTPINGTNGVIPAGTLYSWPAPSVTGGLTGGLTGTNASVISGTLANPTNTTQTATYIITPTSGSCTGSAFTVTVTVNAIAAITAMTATACNGVLFSVTPTNGTNGIVPAATLYTWAAPTGTGFTGGAAQASGVNTITGTLTNTTSSSVTATYIITPTAGNCTGTSFTLTVTLAPGATIAAMTATTCSGVTFTITPTDGVNGIIPAGTTYTWTTPTGVGLTGGAAQATGVSNVFGTLINTTNTVQTATYIVTPSTPCGASASFTLTVTVNPIASITAMTTVSCSGIAFTVSPVNGINGVVPAGTTYSWSTPSVTGGLTGGASGTGATFISGTLSNPTNTAQTATYIVTPNVVNCGSSIPFTVTVTINPNATITPMSSTICSGVLFGITPVNVTNGIIPSGTLYTWSAPTGTGFTGGLTQASAVSLISGTLTNTTSIARTATYTVTPISGNCTGALFTVTVTINPTATVTAMTTVSCSGVAFTITPTDVTNGIIPAGTTFTWTAPTGSGFSGGAAQGSAVNAISGNLTNTTSTVQTATYIVTPTTLNCGAAATFTLTVTLNPAATVIPMSTTTCNGITFAVTPVDGTNGIVPAGTLYTWTAPTGIGFTGGLTQAGGVNTISGTLTNTTNIARTATYAVTPTSGTCLGAVFTVAYRRLLLLTILPVRLPILLMQR
ncbi:unnamed protein product, partial [Sphagnum jensenii]